MKEKETKHVKVFRNTKLKTGEEIVYHLQGWIGEMMGTGDKTQHNGQFFLTNLRVCFYRKGLFGEVLETIPIEKITSVEILTQMKYRVLRLHTSHDELAFKTFESKNLFEKMYESLECVRDAEIASSQSNLVVQSIPDQIKGFAELRDSGILTEEEFMAKKTQLLNKV